MPIPKDEREPLTYERLIAINPELENFEGDCEVFGELVVEAVGQEAFDKKKSLFQEKDFDDTINT